MVRSSRRGIAWVSASAVGFGSVGIWARWAADAGASISTVLGLRFCVASLALIAAAVLFRRPKPQAGQFVGLWVLGFVHVFEATLYFGALRQAGAGLVALLFYVYPAIVAALGVFSGGERWDWKKGAALTSALLGTALTAGGLEGATPLGVILALASATVYALYLFFGARHMGAVDALWAAGHISLASAVGAGALAALTGLALPQTSFGALSVVLMGLVSTALAIGGLAAGVRHIGATQTAMISTLEPLTAVVLGALVLDEPMGVRQVLGGLLILGAVIWLARLVGQTTGAPPESTANPHPAA